MLRLGRTHSFEVPLQVCFAAEAALTVGTLAQDIVVCFWVRFYFSQRVSLFSLLNEEKVNMKLPHVHGFFEACRLDMPENVFHQHLQLACEVT
jgi:hypothetical protein